MSGYQKVVICGRLGRDPETTFTQAGVAICKFNLATSRKKKDGQEITSWHRCTAFQKTAEVIGQYVRKGQELLIEGELSYGQYEKDSVTHYTTDVIVNSFTFVGPKKDGGQQQNQHRETPQNNNGVPDDSIPF